MYTTDETPFLIPVFLRLRHSILLTDTDVEDEGPGRHRSGTVKSRRGLC